MSRVTAGLLAVVSCAVGIVGGLLAGHQFAADWFEAIGVWVGAFGAVGAVGWAAWSLGKQRDTDQALRKRELSFFASRQLHNALDIVFREVANWTPRNDLILDPWLFAVVAYGPDLTDMELFHRVDLVSDQSIAFASWSRLASADGHGAMSASRVTEGDEMVRSLGELVSWLSQSFAAHRTAHPLPDPSVTTRRSDEVKSV